MMHSIQNESAYDFNRKVTDYIKENYSANASLNELSKILHLAHAYLSRLFKKTGKNIQILLLNYHMEIAKKNY
jgi:AraC-like DNA-binding protein